MRAIGLFPLLLVTIVPLRAGVIFGTADPGTGNCFPFGCQPGSVYQQVYAASDFSGAVDITSVSFFRTQFSTSTNAITDATYTVKLSYSANPVNGLDTTTLANNVGAGQVTFGTYVFSGVTAASGVTFTENNSDFLYNPVNGPLLLEIDLSSIGATGDVFFDTMNGDSGGIFSRAQNFGTGFTDFGLVTGFDVNAVPEPGTVALMGVGLLGLAFRYRRKLRA